jgi:2-keto-4-pentenoate hydratase/2-oxohepta-3-ene-1,7-dioic acid hydratase in catechol pathway
VRYDKQGPGQPGLLDAKEQTLTPGDLMVTSTPASVRMGIALPEFLKSGDLVGMSVTALLHNEIVIVS